MPTALVTGASKGLGLEFVRQLAASGWRVHACCRSPQSADSLRALARDAGEHVEVQQLDIDDFASIDELATRFSDEKIDLLINNAGIIDTVPTSFSESSRTTVQALGGINYDGWADVMRTNVVGTMRMAEAFLPNVEASEGKTIVMISSIMGSITANDPDAFPPGGGIYVYRSSKAALNMVARTLAADLKARGITVLSLNPGWVKTDMGGKDAMFTPEMSVGNMLSVVGASSIADTGTFISHDGRRLPW
jgi:NAD(P)-dependent dehydrogenase (short-subunit alcohol dehydrogenase family)